MNYILCVLTTKISEQESSGEWDYYGPGGLAECEAAKAKLDTAPLVEGETRMATLVPLKPLEEA